MFFKRNNDKMNKMLEIDINIMCPNCQRIPLLSVNRNRPYLLHIVCSCSYQQTKTIKDYLIEQIELSKKYKNNKSCNNYNNENSNNNNSKYYLTCCHEKKDINNHLQYHHLNHAFYCNNCQRELCEECAHYHLEKDNHFIIDIQAISHSHLELILSSESILIKERLESYHRRPQKS